MARSEQIQHPAERLLACLDESGLLAARAAKYVNARARAGEALGALMRIGDQARRLGRRGELDAGSAERLVAEAEAVRERLRAIVGAVVRSPEHLAARSAASGGDVHALRELIPRIFAEVVPATPSPLHYAAPLRSHGKLRPPAGAAAAIAELVREGLPADGHPDALGADEWLPAVVLWESAAAAGEAVTLRVESEHLRLPVFCLRATGQRMVYVQRLHVPLRVVIAAPSGSIDAEELEARAPGYTAELEDALAGLGCPVSREPPDHR